MTEKTPSKISDLAEAAAKRRRAPASRYSDPEFLNREIESVFNRAWLVVGLAYRVQHAGDYFTFDEMGHSIAVIRGGDGVLRAFHNVCRHRGTRLLDGTGNVPAVRCPYHDWKYSLDGRLRHVPGADGFCEDIDKGTNGLLPVRVACAMGFVWITLDEQAPELNTTLNGLDAELAPYNLMEMRPIQEKVWTINCNWKAVLDNATESYHLPFVHGGSVDQHVIDKPEFVTYGDHYRLTLGIADYEWRRWVDNATSRGGPYTPKQKSDLHKYVLFPNFLINVLPYHLTIFQLWPDGPDKCRFFYGFYLRKKPGVLEWLRGYATWAASRYILEEDLFVLNRFQQGAQSGQLDEHRFHNGEIAVAHFHQTLSRWLRK